MWGDLLYDFCDDIIEYEVRDFFYEVMRRYYCGLLCFQGDNWFGGGIGGGGGEGW